MIESLKEFRQMDAFGCDTRLQAYKDEMNMIPDDDAKAKQALIYKYHKQEYAKWHEIFG